ncbi:MAG: ABC transporter permease [Acidimicrobiia bacterium]|nr:ABC transporter permease [Acidimicrobiia bacterium]MDH3462759.1 ABC transporter permease [Acidimicrobiia bacterium]
MRYLTAHLYRRLMTRGRIIGLTALASVPALVFVLIGFDEQPDQIRNLYVETVTSAGYTFAIAALVVAGATLREERDGGTLPYIYMRPVSRSSIAVSSLVAGMGGALTIGLLGWIATVLGGLLIGAGPSVTLPGLGLFASTATGYGAIFVPLGYLFSRSLLIGLGYIIVLETILAFAITGLAQLSIWRIGLSIYGSYEEFGVGARESLGPIAAGAGGGLAKLGIVLVLGWGVLTWALRRRDAL